MQRENQADVSRHTHDDFCAILRVNTESRNVKSLQLEKNTYWLRLRNTNLHITNKCTTIVRPVILPYALRKVLIEMTQKAETHFA